MSDENDFGTLRSLLASPTTDASSFDAVIRHLINWSWHDDPRIFERWLGYAAAHLERWPGEARCLHVWPKDEIYLRDIDAWSSLFRAVSITSADGFFEQFVEMVGEGHFSALKHLKLRDLEVAPTTFGISARHAEALVETGALDRLRALDLGSPHNGALDVLLDASDAVHDLTVHVTFIDQATDATTRRRIAERGWTLADDHAWRALWREYTNGVFGW